MIRHNVDQLMAWTDADVKALAGRWISVVAPVDEQAFHVEGLGYTGDWYPLAQGTVESASMDAERGRVHVNFTDGGFVCLTAGEMLNVLEGAP